DNAVVESFFGSLKRESFTDRQLASRSHTEAAVIDYIDNYYNRKRLHSSLGFTPPVEYEMQAVV
ncbi:MAG: IS3 family transposase, partial [Hymenobacter sp.]